MKQELLMMSEELSSNFITQLLYTFKIKKFKGYSGSLNLDEVKSLNLFLRRLNKVYKLNLHFTDEQWDYLFYVVLVKTVPAKELVKLLNIFDIDFKLDFISVKSTGASDYLNFMTEDGTYFTYTKYDRIKFRDVQFNGQNWNELLGIDTSIYFTSIISFKKIYSVLKKEEKGHRKSPYEKIADNYQKKQNF